MEDCVAISDEDVATLTQMGEAFEHPKQLIIDAENNVIMNGVAILKDIKAGIKDMNTAKFEQAGKEFGTIAALVLWGSQNFAPEASFLQ
mmetsp:Transcript_27714/g.37017  ORF Transcript_27714/g.37017 Transcript_27714/m.37017 type:complete len:89 (-) Transcript_27714:180-446(-)|eukprot:CAMPEP_0170467974 /NCGR_PEP_ID=MMETSP0123-20130129/11341_1 /TAXON_ID=182087 /ORGANISM="Favella ehrenbergii, Strain Fehren 1" /LENGTH=88 /DNA_ID=CAMNT_0010734453 /DNA_START=351 /DNA_END=617 /DNA_ORIENTATION=+